jgi:hypothetical protein
MTTYPPVATSFLTSIPSISDVPETHSAIAQHSVPADLIERSRYVQLFNVKWPLHTRSSGVRREYSKFWGDSFEDML